MAAGVRSIISTPRALSFAAVLGMHVGAGGVEGDLHAVGQHVGSRPSTPSAVVLMPISRPA
jgi:hypothetical protein